MLWNIEYNGKYRTWYIMVFWESSDENGERTKRRFSSKQSFFLWMVVLFSMYFFLVKIAHPPMGLWNFMIIRVSPSLFIIHLLSSNEQNNIFSFELLWFRSFTCRYVHMSTFKRPFSFQGILNVPTYSPVSSSDFFTKPTLPFTKTSSAIILDWNKTFSSFLK